MEDGGAGGAEGRERGELTPADQAFWDDFYGPRGEADGAFEWYLAFEHARQCFERYLSPELLVLQVGCGTSSLADDLLRCDLARHVVSIDSCEPAIERMRGTSVSTSNSKATKNKKHGKGRGKRKTPTTTATSTATMSSENASSPSIPLTIGNSVVQLAPKGATYHLMDACAMTFPAHSFDAVVDKGTLDAMLSVEDEEQSSCWRMMEEIVRVLKPDGIYLVVSGHPKDWVAGVFAKSGLWRMDELVHSPVKVPLGHTKTDNRAVEGEDQENSKKYTMTCSFWALKPATQPQPRETSNVGS